MRAVISLFVLLCGSTISQAASFSVTIDGSSQSGFALFNPNSPHTARNANGIFIAYQAAANAAYTANTENVVWFAGDPATTAPVTLSSSTGVTEPPCIVAAWTGEVFSIEADWINNIITVQKWANVTVSTTPQTFTFPGRPQRGNGKFSCAFDEQRRVVMFVGGGGEFVEIDENGTLVSVASVFSAGTYPMQYPNIAVGADGQVDMAWETVDTSFTVLTQYRDIRYLGSRYPGAAWSANGQAPWQWQTGVAPIPPDETGPSWAVTYTDEITANQNKQLTAMLADNNGNVHFVYMAAPTPGETCFHNGGNRCTLTYLRKNRLTQDALPAVVKRPFRAQKIFPHSAYGGLLAIRGNSLYFITAYGNQIVAMVSPDWGNTWQDSTSLTIPNLDANSCVKDLNGDRGTPGDPDIIGTFAIWHGGNCSAWAASTSPAGATDVVFWRLSPTTTSQITASQ